jgi:DNA invertase Pin-like site-specific DNA recombinase
MKYGYARASIDDQSAALQVTALKRPGAKRFSRMKGFQARRRTDGACGCLKALQPGDKLTVWKLDRLGRSSRDLVSLMTSAPVA